MKYNALAVTQMGLRTAAALLLVRIFGVSLSMDAYFIGISILTALQAFEFLFVEQFMYFYADAKRRSAADAADFYGFSFCLALAVGAFFSLLCLFGAKPLSFVFAASLDSPRMAELVRLLPLLAPMAFFGPAAYVNERLLNAEEKFSLPYLTGIISLCALLSFQLWMLALGTADAAFMAAASSFEAMIAFAAGMYFCRKAGFSPRLVLRHPLALAFIRNSFAMRAGHGIYGFAFSLITNNALASLPGGYVSCFNYAQRALSVAHAVVTGPPLRILQAKLAAFWAGGRMAEGRLAVADYAKGALFLFFAAAAAAYLALPLILALAGGTSISPADISNIRSVFLSLSVWYGLVIFEAAFVSVCVAAKDSLVFIATNSVFSVIYWAVVFTALPRFGVYALAIGAALAQAVNLTVYYSAAMRHLRAGEAA